MATGPFLIRQVRIQKASEVPPGATVRTITIWGTGPQREKAEKHVRDTLAPVDPLARRSDPLGGVPPSKRPAVENLHAMTNAPYLTCLRALDGCNGDAEAAFEKLLIAAEEAPRPAAGAAASSSADVDGWVRVGGGPETEEEAELRRVQALSLATAEAEAKRLEMQARKLAHAWSTWPSGLWRAHRPRAPPAELYRRCIDGPAPTL